MVVRLLPLLLVLLLPGVAGAHETQYIHAHAYEREIPIEIETESDVDRFLSEQVRLEIEAGDRELTGEEMSPSWAIAHYLKALVLIEQERLRRESK